MHFILPKNFYITKQFLPKKFVKKTKKNKNFCAEYMVIQDNCGPSLLRGSQGGFYGPIPPLARKNFNPLPIRLGSNAFEFDVRVRKVRGFCSSSSSSSRVMKCSSSKFEFFQLFSMLFRAKLLINN